MNADLSTVNGAQVVLATKRGNRYQLPIFLPVYKAGGSAFDLAREGAAFGVEGAIVNAFFLYKRRELRELLTEQQSLPQYLGFDGLLATDSGAFQGFSRPLYLQNRKIVQFQDRIGSDIVSPLDLVTPPGDRRSVAEDKLRATEKRIREALKTAEQGIVAGVQQGGRFADLRYRGVCALVEMGVQYVALGSLVPFFNNNHNLEFVGETVHTARRVIGNQIPLHVYGAGDPVEIPFLVALGATVFDSASYAHYAKGGWYMTPYGALTSPAVLKAGEYSCSCTSCSEGVERVFGDERLLLRHNLHTILRTVLKLRTMSAVPGELSQYLRDVTELHSAWFPASELAGSWERVMNKIG